MLKHSIVALIFLNAPAYAQSSGACQGAAMQQLTALEAKMNAYSKSVSDHTTKWPESKLKDDTTLISYCLEFEGKKKSAQLGTEGFAIYDQLEAFAKSQTGDCKAAAEKAVADTERNVRKLLGMTKLCNKNIK